MSKQIVSRYPESLLRKAAHALSHGIMGNIDKLDKVGLVDEIADALSLNKFTMDEFKAAMTQNKGVQNSACNIAPVSTVSPNTIKIVQDHVTIISDLSQTVSSVGSQVNRLAAETSALKGDITTAVAAIDHSNNVLNDLAQKVSDFTTEINRKVGKIKAPSATVDQAQVESLIGQAVGQAFAQFKTEASPEQIAEIADSQLPHTLRTCADVFGIDLHDRSGIPVMVKCFDSLDAPAVLSDYVFPEEHLRQAIALFDHGMNIWGGGERSTGKTSFFEQYAARTGRPLVRISCHKDMDSISFIGGDILSGGSCVFREGIVLKAALKPATVVLFDEMSALNPHCAIALHSLLEIKPVRTIETDCGKKFTVAQDVVFCAADNTLGCGDESGNYSGTNECNSALTDRFQTALKFDYLPESAEVKLIVGRTGIGADAALSIVKLANVARTKAASGALTQPPSLRQLLAWAHLARLGVGVQSAFESCVVNKYPKDCAPELLAIFAACIDVDQFNEGL